MANLYIEWTPLWWTSTKWPGNGATWVSCVVATMRPASGWFCWTTSPRFTSASNPRYITFLTAFFVADLNPRTFQASKHEVTQEVYSLMASDICNTHISTKTIAFSRMRTGFIFTHAKSVLFCKIFSTLIHPVFWRTRSANTRQISTTLTSCTFLRKRGGIFHVFDWNPKWKILLKTRTLVQRGYQAERRLFIGHKVRRFRKHRNCAGVMFHV